MKVNQNSTMNDFINELPDKNLVCFGAGKMLVDALQDLEEYKFENNISCIIDNDKEKWGKSVEIGKRVIPIKSIDFLKEINENETILLITSQYFQEILNQIGSNIELDNIDCYIYPLLKVKTAIGKESNKPKFILTNIPNHNNLGDHAIAMAENKFLKDYFENDIIELTGEFYRKYRQFLKEHIHVKDIILLTGGGYIGTLWRYDNEILNMLITDFPNNKIIIFPQTIYYSDDEEGKQKFEDSIRLYNNHKHLTICTRDKTSYQLAKNAYTENNVFLFPDMVLYS